MGPPVIQRQPIEKSHDGFTYGHSNFQQYTVPPPASETRPIGSSKILKLPVELRPPTASKLNLLQLELLHHYTASACLAISDKPSIQQEWQISVPREALSHECLMYAILATAAVHLMNQSLTLRHRYEKDAIYHRRLALRSAIPQFQDITPRNCHALFAVSSIVAILAFAFPNPSPISDSHTIVDGMIEFFILVRGVQIVLGTASSWIEDGDLMYLTRYSWTEKLSPVSEPVERAFDLLNERNEKTTKDPEVRKSYSVAIKILHKAFRTYKIISDERSLVFIWPVIVPELYMTQLKVREPMALVVLAHFAVLLHSINGLWWSQNRGAQLVVAIWHLLPPDWQSVIDWPVEVTKGEMRCQTATDYIENLATRRQCL